MLHTTQSPNTRAGPVTNGIKLKRNNLYLSITISVPIQCGPIELTGRHLNG